jgi:hypothetical protein
VTFLARAVAITILTPARMRLVCESASESGDVVVRRWIDTFLESPDASRRSHPVRAGEPPHRGDLGRRRGLLELHGPARGQLGRDADQQLGRHEHPGRDRLVLDDDRDPDRARHRPVVGEERVDGMKRLTPSSTWWHTLPHRENALTGARGGGPAMEYVGIDLHKAWSRAPETLMLRDTVVLG